ncbi:MAG: cytochrome c maturation protein CcmE [Chloroflexi bacterium]|nr:cytochrome c maturation protein CcmE [Chloroflexota bacterium]
MASVVHSSPSPARSLPGGGNLKFIIAGGVIALAVAYLVTMGLRGTTEYFLTVSELQAQGASAQNQVLRVSGTLVPGSLEHDGDGLSVHFLIADTPASTPLTVTYTGGQVPDTMADTSAGDVQIVAEGKLNAQGTFAANDVLAKCPSRLEDAAPPEEHDYAASAS